MNLYYDRATSLFLLTRAEPHVTMQRVDCERMLDEITAARADITLFGRRFRVWTDAPASLQQHLRDSGEQYGSLEGGSREQVEDAITRLGEYGLHMEVLRSDREANPRHCHVHIEREEHEASYSECIAHLALYAATAHDPEACRAHVNGGKE